MNKYLIIASIAISIILVWAAYAVSNKGTENIERVTAAIQPMSDSFDFGDIDIFGGKVETTYTLENTGAEDVSIVSAQTSCMCTEGEIDGLRFGMHERSGGVVVIPAGESKILTAIFDPLAHGPDGTGPITRELLLKTNSETTPEVTVRFSGNVIKDITN